MISQNGKFTSFLFMAFLYNSLFDLLYHNKTTDSKCAVILVQKREGLPLKVSSLMVFFVLIGCGVTTMKFLQALQFSLIGQRMIQNGDKKKETFVSNLRMSGLLLFIQKKEIAQNFPIHCHIVFNLS